MYVYAFCIEATLAKSRSDNHTLNVNLSESPGTCVVYSSVLLFEAQTPAPALLSSLVRPKLFSD